MKDDIKTELGTLEEATAVGEPSEPLDAETASLREAWLAFGEAIEAARPRELVFTRLAEQSAEMRASRIRRRWRRLLAVDLLAASVLIAVAIVSIVSSGRQPDGRSPAAPAQIAKTGHPSVPSPKALTHSKNTAEAPKWDDSFDEQVEEIRWQMLCVQQNQAFRTGPFGQAQYRLEELSQTIQADSL